MKLGYGTSIGLVALTLLATAAFYRDATQAEHNTAPILESRENQIQQNSENADQTALRQLSGTQEDAESDNYRFAAGGNAGRESAFPDLAAINSQTLGLSARKNELSDEQPVEIGEHLAVDECCEQQSGPAREIGEVLIP